MVEQLPVIYTEADIPQRCQGCPLFEDRTGQALTADGPDNESRTDKEMIRRQVVSDFVREMQLCQSGPIEQPDETRPEPAKELVLRCGLEANPYNIPNSEGDRVMGRVFRQQEEHRRYLQERDFALDPDAFFHPLKGSLLAMLREVSPLDEEGIQANLLRVNQLRHTLGLSPYIYKD